MTDCQMMEALARQALHARKRTQKPRIGWCRSPKEAYAHWMDSPRRSEFINCEVRP